MDTKEITNDNVCVFYASEMHLEMIILPYIKNKLEKNEKIYLINEINLKESIKKVLKKMNLNQETKENILKLNWDNNSNKIESINKEKNKTVIFISGNQKFNKRINDKIKKRENIEIINCYNIDSIENDNLFKNKSCKLLTTTGIKEF